MIQPTHPVFTHSTSRCESLKLFIPHYPCINERIEFFTLTLRAPTQNRVGELLSPRSPGPQKRWNFPFPNFERKIKMEFSVFIADVRPSSGSKKLSLGAAQTYSGYEEAGVHHMEENPTRLCMPSHWTGETYSPEVELSKRDRSNAPTPYCLFRGGRKRLWDHSTFIAFQSYCKTGI